MDGGYADGENITMDDALSNFMLSRGVPAEGVRLMKEEKIDCNTIKLMSDEQLTPFLPKYGDRAAVMEFCKRDLCGTSKRKVSLLERLRKKIENKKRSSDGDEETAPNTKVFQLKRNRTIELGWIHKQADNFIQVRLKQGGGTRKISVPRTATKDFIIQEGQKLFFPHGVSPKGDLSFFNFDLWDFKESIIPENVSVSEIYSTSGLRTLRLYMATKEREDTKCVTNATAENDTHGNNNSEKTEIVGEQNFPDGIVYSLVRTPPHNSMHLVEIPDIYNDNYVFDDQSVYVSSIDEPSHHISASAGSEEMVEFLNFQPQNAIALNSPAAAQIATKLTLHRGQIMEELINAFMGMETNCGLIQVQLILPNGQEEKAFDSGGVYRDCLSEFWESFYEKCTTGTKAKVPYLRHDFGELQWRAVAKIISKGWKDEKYFPIKLSVPFLEQCIFGKPESNIVDEFMYTLSNNDSDILVKALRDITEVDEGDLEDVLQNLDCKWKPTQENMKQLISDIAHKEIIQKPMFIIDSWNEELHGLLTRAQMLDIIKSKQPTSKNILKLLTLSTDHSLTSEMTTTFGYLKKYIREAEEKFLTSFLRFTTGADIITQRDIQISFISTEGFQRAPIAHTCTPLLELPYSFNNFIEFRSEMNSILTSNIWIMDIV